MLFGKAKPDDVLVKAVAVKGRCRNGRHTNLACQPLAKLGFAQWAHGRNVNTLEVGALAGQEALKASPHVKRFEAGMDKEGGDGVTVAHLDLD